MTSHTESPSTEPAMAWPDVRITYTTSRGDDTEVVAVDGVDLAVEPGWTLRAAGAGPRPVHGAARPVGRAGRVELGFGHGLGSQSVPLGVPATLTVQPGDVALTVDAASAV